MACACAKAKEPTLKYIYTPAGGGAKVTYKTEAEARNAVVQRGGSYAPHRI